MIQFEFYQHPNCTDTCIEVLRYFPIPSQDRAKVKVLWWRVKSGQLSYCIGVEEKFDKPITYWNNWVRVKKET